MNYGTRVDFDAGSVPSSPPPAIAETIDDTDALYIAMKGKFAQRPVWSRQALVASLPPTLFLTNERMKYRLPMLAYYFQQGPWRMCWVAYGYDPRRSSDSRVYQVTSIARPQPPMP